MHRGRNDLSLSPWNNISVVLPASLQLPYYRGFICNLQFVAEEEEGRARGGKGRKEGRNGTDRKEKEEGMTCRMPNADRPTDNIGIGGGGPAARPSDRPTERGKEEGWGSCRRCLSVCLSAAARRNLRWLSQSFPLITRRKSTQKKLRERGRRKKERKARDSKVERKYVVGQRLVSAGGREGLGWVALGRDRR